MRILPLIVLIVLVLLNIRGFLPGLQIRGSAPLVVDEYVGFPMTYVVKIRESKDSAEGERISTRIMQTIPFHSYGGLHVVRRDFMLGAFLIDMGIILIVTGITLKAFYRFAF